MKSKINSIALILLFVFGISCNSQKITKKAISTGDNSMTSVDWPGTYQGVIPCGDCEGIQIQIVLQKDLNYIMDTRYLGKDDKVFQTKGTFQWNSGGSAITINNPEKQIYQVGENRLFHLDKDGKRITGNLADNYILKKEVIEITGKHWTLIELKGQPVKIETREPFITFNQQDSLVNGNSSCNNFNGKYKVSNENKINFSPLMMTKMACIDNKIEDDFMKILEAAAQYTQTLRTLILLDSENKTLAKFEANFFQ